MKKLYLKEKKILILAPHPDDEVIGCGGLILTYPQQSDILFLTNGCHGGLLGEVTEDVKNNRKKEASLAMSYANINKFSFLEVEDGKLSENFNNFSEIDFSPYDIVFCPSSKDEHKDHACVYEFLLKLNISAEIYMYEVWTPVAATHYLDISELITKKKKLISFYKSQLAQVSYDSRVIGLNHFRGLIPYPAIDYAEAYHKV